MIIITLNNSIKKFNLKNNEREKALYNAWISMRDDEKYANIKLKITTHTGTEYLLKISEIKDCKYEDCLYFDNPEVLKSPKDKSSNFMSQLNNIEKDREEKNIEIFFNELKKQNIIINFKDPALLKILSYVKAEHNNTKISFYAKLYANMKNKY